jgi:hypothetical protein
VIYIIPSGSVPVVNLNQEFQMAFKSVYLNHNIHPSFSQLQINPNTFAPQWNRDFRNPSTWLTGEKRGCQPYNPPKGWMRYGMNVQGRFADGDTWLGMSNIPGEWCVAYHGTKSGFVNGIITNPLKAGTTNAYGYGIYCSPDVSTSEGYTDCLDIPTNSGTGKIKCKYIFMCRVNTRSIHHCTQRPCPSAYDNQYTFHMTVSPNIWFVNCNNSNYQNIRPYGLLVKEVP